MSPVTRPDSAGANGQEFQQILRAVANNPDPAKVDWAALQRAIMLRIRADAVPNSQPDANPVTGQ